MRLICPNCGAQYEVDDAVIPDQGRDVQCSNCGHTWFQQPAHLDANLAEELDLPLPEDPDEDTAPPHQSETVAEAPRQRRGLDPNVADVLRQEAEREAAVRRAEADGLETQPDLGLDDSVSDAAAERTAAARARMARLRGQSEEGSPDATNADPAASDDSRSELLPDVEEINSTLRASQDRDHIDDSTDEAPEDTPKPSRRSSKLLSRLIILIALAGVLIYMFAPQIINAVPQTEPYLVQYVDWANELRGQINAWIDMAVTKMRGLNGNSI